MTHSIGIFGACAVALASTLSIAADTPKAHDHEHGPAPAKEAVCIMMPTKGHKAQGTLTLTQESGDVHVQGEVTGLKPGSHGFHIHVYGDLRKDDGASAGGHYGAEGHEHGGPDSKDRHAGDLGNIKANNEGVAKVDVKAQGLHLHFVLGRSMVIHADADDFKTQPSGNSGARVAVGVIGVANTDPPAPPKK